MGSDWMWPSRFVKSSSRRGGLPQRSLSGVPLRKALVFRGHVGFPYIRKKPQTLKPPP